MPASTWPYDEYVDRTKMLNRLIDQALAVFCLGNVCLAGNSITTSRSYLVDYTGSAIRGHPIVHNYAGSFTRKRQSSAAANPFSCGTCYNGNSSFHIRIVFA